MKTSDYRIEVYKTDRRYRDGERIVRVVNLDDVTKEYAAAAAKSFKAKGYRVDLQEQWVTVKNLMTGKDIKIDAKSKGTCCDPSTETYWCM